jgi:hypothetical protein
MLILLTHRVLFRRTHQSFSTTCCLNGGETDLPHFNVKLLYYIHVFQAGEIQPDNMLENNIKTVEVRQSFKVNSAYKNSIFIVFSIPLETVENSKPQRGENGREETARVFLSFCPPSWSIHNFSGDGNSESATVAVSKQDFLDKDAKTFLAEI